MQILDSAIGNWTPRRISRHFKYDSEEIKELNKSSILISLIFFFFVWARKDLTILTGIITYLFCFIASGLSLFIFTAIPKLIAIKRGTQAEYKSFTMGLLFSFVISYLSYGFVAIPFPGIIEISAIKRLKHGEVFHYETKKDIFAVLVSAPLSLLVLSLIIGLINSTSNIFLLRETQIILSILAFVTILPLPKNIGLHLLYVRKNMYFQLFALFFLFLITTLINSIYIILPGILGGLILGYMFSKWEKNPLKDKN